MEERRIMHRVTLLEESLQKHLEEHAQIEKTLKDNTESIQKIETNTSELVDLIKGVKGLRSFIVWWSPVAMLILALLAWFKGFK